MSSENKYILKVFVTFDVKLGQNGSFVEANLIIFNQKLKILGNKGVKRAENERNNKQEQYFGQNEV